MVAPTCVNYGMIVLALMAMFDLYWPHVGFYGAGKPSSFCNYFVELSLPASRWFVGGRLWRPSMAAEPDIAESQDFIPRVET
jgi:hypothetical protein